MNSSPLVQGGGLVIHELAGGHTLARHIGLTDSDLFNRLATRTTLPRVSSFFNRQTAERSISEAIEANHIPVIAWLSDITARFQINYTCSEPIGVTLLRGADSPIPAYRLQVILIRTLDLSLGYYILTAYPEL